MATHEPGCMRRGRWVFVTFIALAALFLLLEHRAHALGVLPLLLLLACPLMHIFMHRGHGETAAPGRDGERLE